MNAGWYKKATNLDMLTQALLFCLQQSLHTFDTLAINNVLNSFYAQPDASVTITNKLQRAIKDCIRAQRISLTDTQQKCVAYIRYMCTSADDNRAQNTMQTNKPSVVLVDNMNWDDKPPRVDIFDTEQNAKSLENAV